MSSSSRLLSRAGYGLLAALAGLFATEWEDFSGKEKVIFAPPKELADKHAVETKSALPVDSGCQ